MSNLKATQVVSSFINMFPSCWDYQYPSITAVEVQFNCEENSVDRAGKYCKFYSVSLLVQSIVCINATDSCTHCTTPSFYSFWFLHVLCPYISLLSQAQDYNSFLLVLLCAKESIIVVSF